MNQQNSGRTQLSAGVERSVHVLSRLQDKLFNAVPPLIEDLGNGKTAYVTESSFIGDINRMLVIMDIGSVERRKLIYEFLATSASSYASWKTGQNEVALYSFPAQEFRRVENEEKPRPRKFWPERWQEAGVSIGWVGALQSPMIALKTSPIWENLSAFGVPWPPFDCPSAWDVIDVRRNEAEERGLIKRGENIMPIEAEFKLEMQLTAFALALNDGKLLPKAGSAVADLEAIDRWIDKLKLIND